MYLAWTHWIIDPLPPVSTEEPQNTFDGGGKASQKHAGALLLARSFCGSTSTKRYSHGIAFIKNAILWNRSESCGSVWNVQQFRQSVSATQNLIKSEVGFPDVQHVLLLVGYCGWKLNKKLTRENRGFSRRNSEDQHVSAFTPGVM